MPCRTRRRGLQTAAILSTAKARRRLVRATAQRLGWERGWGLVPDWASGTFLPQATEQQGSSCQTKSSLGCTTDGSHSHSRLNTLKIFLVAEILN